MIDQQYPVAVYGTLRENQPNHRLLAGLWDSQVLGICDGFEMYSVGPFPFIKRGEGSVIVEVYTINPQSYETVLRRMDMLEGYHPEDPDSLYRRELVDVQLTDDRQVKAWIYIGHTVENERAYKKIESGDWVQAQNEKWERKGGFFTIGIQEPA